MATSPEDADAMFDLASTGHAGEAAETGADDSAQQLEAAALSAFGFGAGSTPGAEGLPFGGQPPLGIDSRREPRVRVSWPGRVQLPNGRVVELRVRDISESGVGLLTPVTIPAGVTIQAAIGVPGFDVPVTFTAVTGTLRASYSVLQGSDIHCGGTWVDLTPEGRELLVKWIRKLRR